MRAAALLILCAGCYDPKFGDATTCGPSMACPPGRTCVDGLCRTADARLADAGPTTVTFKLIKASLAGGTGRVFSADIGLDCGTDCTEQAVPVHAGQPFTLEVQPGDAAYFQGWSGGCPGPARRCDLSVTEYTELTARFSLLDHNLVFVTRDRVQGDFGGLAVADEACRNAAAEMGITATVVAMVVDQDTDLRERLRHPAGGVPRGFIRLDGKPIADTLDDLVVLHRIWYPVLYDQDGNLGPAFVWTGSDASGEPELHCGNWTRDDLAAIAGLATGGATMVRGPAISCMASAGFTCVMVAGAIALDAPSRPPALPGDRAIYISEQKFMVPGGRVQADSICDDERPGVRRGLALLAIPGEPARQRLVPTARYLRPDGIVVGTGAEIAEGTLQSGIWVRGGGGYSLEHQVWTGSEAVDMGGEVDSCNGWGTITQEARYGAPSTDAMRWWNNGKTSCMTGLLPLYCVEE